MKEANGLIAMKKAKELIASVRELAKAYPRAFYIRGWTGTDWACDNVKGKVRLQGGGFLPEEGCIIGQAVRIAWSDSDTMKLLLRHHDKNVLLLLSEMGVAHDAHGRRWLSRVQALQDGGICWGEAVRRADESIEEV